MDGKRIRCLQIVSQHVRIYIQQFVSYSDSKCKKSPFLRTEAHIFVSHGDAPATITQYVVWMERQFNSCQTPRSMYLSIFNSFRVIRCLSQYVSPKIAIFTSFLFPLGTLHCSVLWTFLSTFSDKKSCNTSTTLQNSPAQFVSDSWAFCTCSIYYIPSDFMQIWDTV